MPWNLLEGIFKFVRHGIALLPLLCLTGCAELGYYVQAAKGQVELLAASRPLQQVLEDPATDPKLKLRLQTAEQLRAFASRELALPDNNSYRRYAHLSRSHVLWNVVATPELSLQPLIWCFPIAGCVSYRGYYDQAQAQAFAATLREQGHDVQVSGTPAYSTLGWFSDPLLSTFIWYPDADLARLMFHELSHQVLYVPGDSQFNESFATAVELAGIQRWLACSGTSNQALHTSLQRQQDFLRLLREHRQLLQDNYQSTASDEDKRARKQEIFQHLQQAYQRLKQEWGGYTGYDRWFAQPVGNAHLTAVATYHDLVPGFTTLLRQQNSYTDFYRAAQNLGADGQRLQKLQQLATQSLPPNHLEQGPCASNKSGD